MHFLEHGLVGLGQLEVQQNSLHALSQWPIIGREKGLEELSVWSLAGSQNCSVDEDVAVLFDWHWQGDRWWQPYGYGATGRYRSF